MKSAMRAKVRLLQQAVFVSCTLLVVGCGTAMDASETDDATLRDAPVVTGNTFDRYNDMAVVPPNSENISVSYRFTLASDGDGDSFPGENGLIWLYAQRDTATPESFFQIGLMSGDKDEPEQADGAADTSEQSGDDIGPLIEAVRLGSIRYDSVLHCVDLSSSEIPDSVAGYIANVKMHGYDLSNSVFIRHYTGEKPGLDGRWLSMAYIQDISRSGYDCASIGDPNEPEIDYIDAIGEWKEEAGRTFEVVR